MTLSMTKLHYQYSVQNSSCDITLKYTGENSSTQTCHRGLIADHYTIYRHCVMCEGRTWLPFYGPEQHVQNRRN